MLNDARGPMSLMQTRPPRLSNPPDQRQRRSANIGFETRSVSHPAVDRALDFIHSNYWRALRLHDVAEETSLTKYHFTRLFHQSVGVTFREYLIRFRIEKAKQLFQSQPYRSVTSVAHAVGFGTLRSFESQFKRHTAQTPSAYRNRARAPQHLSRIPQHSSHAVGPRS